MEHPLVIEAPFRSIQPAAQPHLPMNKKSKTQSILIEEILLLEISARSSIYHPYSNFQKFQVSLPMFDV